MDARLKLAMLIVDCSRPHQKLIFHATDFCLVDTMLHNNPDLVIDWVQIWDIWMPQVWRNKVWCFIIDYTGIFPEKT